MAFIVRVFCTDAATPSLGEIFAWTARHGFSLSLDPGSADAPLDAPNWVVAGVLYAPGRRPFLVDAKRDTGRYAPLFREEVAGFVERVQRLPASEGRERVLAHLARTRYVVANEYLSDADDVTLSAGGALLDYFVAQHGGMVHADDEGFWQGDALVLPLPG
jgi:hypothetical protein